MHANIYLNASTWTVIQSATQADYFRHIFIHTWRTDIVVDIRCMQIFNRKILEEYKIHNKLITIHA